MEKSLQIQSSYYSALILSLHCTPLSIIVLSQLHPASLKHKDTSNCLPDSECHTLSFKRGRHCSWWHLQAHLTLKLGLGDLRQAQISPVGASLCKKSDAKITWTLPVLFFLKWATRVLMSSSFDFEYQQFMARVSRVKKHLPAVTGGFCFDSEAQPYKYKRVRKPRLGNTSLCLFELLPNIWDLFKHTIC